MPQSQLAFMYVNGKSCTTNCTLSFCFNYIFARQYNAFQRYIFLSTEKPNEHQQNLFLKKGKTTHTEKVTIFDATFQF